MLSALPIVSTGNCAAASGWCAAACSPPICCSRISRRRSRRRRRAGRLAGRGRRRVRLVLLSIPITCCSADGARDHRAASRTSAAAALRDSHDRPTARARRAIIGSVHAVCRPSSRPSAAARRDDLPEAARRRPARIASAAHPGAECAALRSSRPPNSTDSSAEFAHDRPDPPNSTICSAKTARFRRRRFAGRRARRRRASTPRRTRSRSVLGWFAGELEWSRPWDRVLDWQPPHAKWFVGGTAQRQRQLPRSPRATAAPQQGRDHLGRRAGRSPHADLLRSLPRGLAVRQRPEVARRRARATASRIYLPLIPELAIAMLACARIGAVHSVVFGGFSAESLRDRINDAQARLLDHRRRRLPPRPASCRSSRWPTRRSTGTPSIEHVVVVQRGGGAADPGHDEGRPRPLVSRPDARRAAALRAGADGRGGHALHPLHLGHHRQAEGHRAHDRRLSGRHLRHDQAGLRPARTTTSTGARRTSAG